MSASDKWKLLVFREGKLTRNLPALRHELVSQIEHILSLSDFESQYARDEVIDALLRAGELECALEDTEDSAAAVPIAALSDELAQALVAHRRPSFSPQILGKAFSVALPVHGAISPPEGFCYYALHPLDYADLLAEVNLRVPVAGVIGIRSIGTTLSAVVKAVLEFQGTSAQRITVRPTGYPFDRNLFLNSGQREWISSLAQRNAMYFVVDEGPGLSGSSFLSVAEALADAGVMNDRLILLPSSKPNLPALLAPNASVRWSKFRTLPLRATKYIPEDAASCINGDGWRKRVFGGEAGWPAVWLWTERQKYISKDGQRIYRFDGHAHYGKAVRRRSELLAAHGWGPGISSAGDGFSVFPWVDGIRSGTVDRQAVVQLARYCAFRSEHFACQANSSAQLEEMASVNLERALGISHKASLPVERPVIADARMMPHEWIGISAERMLKVDAASHGNDHFYPGPTDIAWDLAGAIAEWKLGKEASELLVSEYQRISGDHIKGRLPAYLLAYCAFRLGFTSSAALSVHDADEQRRFVRESEMYRRRLVQLLCAKAKHDTDRTDFTEPTDSSSGRMPIAECRLPALHE